MAKKKETMNHDEFVMEIFRHRIMIKFAKPCMFEIIGIVKEIEFVPEEVLVDDKPGIQWVSNIGEYSFVVLFNDAKLDVEKAISNAVGYVTKHARGKIKRTVTVTLGKV